MNSVKLDVASELCSNLSSLIRSKISRLPHLEELVSDYDEVHTGDVSIYNYMWNSKGLRKLHIERAVTSKGIEILHCVLFPDPEYPIPIFGCDIVEAGGKVTAAIVDVSPVHKVDYGLGNITYNFKKNRHLPEWGEIFSPWCKFVRLEESEYDNFLLLCSEYLEVFCHIVRTAERETDGRNTMRRYDDQLWYCTSQMKNKKTEAVLSQWFDNPWATKYIQNILFDKPKLR